MRGQVAETPGGGRVLHMRDGGGQRGGTMTIGIGQAPGNSIDTIDGGVLAVGSDTLASPVDRLFGDATSGGVESDASADLGIPTSPQDGEVLSELGAGAVPEMGLAVANLASASSTNSPMAISGPMPLDMTADTPIALDPYADGLGSASSRAFSLANADDDIAQAWNPGPGRPAIATAMPDNAVSLANSSASCSVTLAVVVPASSGTEASASGPPPAPAGFTPISAAAVPPRIANAISSAGDTLVKGNLATSAFGVTGQGIKIGIISTSFNALDG